MSEKLPPQNIEAEMSVLGGIFLDNEVVDLVQGILKSEDFYREIHRLIFQAMCSLANRNEPIDLVTASAELKAGGRLEQVGGGAYLAVLVDYVPMSANTAYYSRIVADRAIDRRLILGAREATEIVYGGGDRAEAIAKLEAVILPVADFKSSQPVGMGEAVRESVKRIEHRYETKGKVQGLPYGIDALDDATSGMHPGELIIVAGRPSMGKSAFAGNVLATTGASGKTGMLFTLEMSRPDTTDRLAAGQKVRYQSIRNGQLEPWEWERLTMAMSQLHGWNLFIDDTPAISLREIRTKAKRQKREGLDLIVVDYLQLMAMSNSKDNRTQGLGEISRGLKQLARELNVPVMALSQLNRSVDSRADKRPTMSDLRDSGEIEQDADVILFPYRPSAYCQECRDRVDHGSHDLKQHQAKAEIIIEKQRAGERNISVPVCWIGHYQKFVGV